MVVRAPSGPIVARTACLALLALLGRLACGQSASPATEHRLSAEPADRAALEAFLDGVLAAQREAHHIAGATVAVVAHSQLVLAKGYGYADLAKGRRVEADRTLFRIASISKLFTWTAVMQLVERGRLDLDADVNRYLEEVQIPGTFPEPVTMRHLMTHTAGFEDRVIGLFARSPERLLPLARLLRDEMPARVRPPGRLASYSNHGTALAGLIVERISGLPWEDYVERSILEPLGMGTRHRGSPSRPPWLRTWPWATATPMGRTGRWGSSSFRHGPRER